MLNQPLYTMTKSYVALFKHNEKETYFIQEQINLNYDESINILSYLKKTDFEQLQLPVPSKFKTVLLTTLKECTKNEILKILHHAIKTQEIKIEGCLKDFNEIGISLNSHFLREYFSAKNKEHFQPYNLNALFF